MYIYIYVIFVRYTCHGSGTHDEFQDVSFLPSQAGFYIYVYIYITC